MMGQILGTAQTKQNINLGKSMRKWEKLLIMGSFWINRKDNSYLKIRVSLISPKQDIQCQYPPNMSNNTNSQHKPTFHLKVLPLQNDIQIKQQIGSSQMKQTNNREVNDFQEELQGKLNFISQRRSNKKFMLKPNPIYQQRDQYQGAHSDKIYHNNISHTNNSDKKKQQLPNHSPQHNPPNKTPTMLKQHHQQATEMHNQNPELSTISNKQLYTFLINFPQQRHQIDLSYFLAKSLAVYSDQPDIPQSHIKQIFLLLQSQITTTDPNVVSVNALEMAIKKKANSLKLFIGDIIMRAKFILENKVLREKQKAMQKNMNDNEQLLRNKLKEVEEKEKVMAEREKFVSKKEKNNSNKQKQLIERIKNSKAILQQKVQKLSEHHLAQLQTVSDKIQKRLQNCQRNIKIKMQNICKKLTEIQQAKQLKQQNIRNSAIKEIQEKLQKIHTTKQKKHQNEISELIKRQQHLKKENKQLCENNKTLTKTCSKLQSKVNKQQTKIKQFNLILDNKNVQIKQLQTIVQKLNEDNQQLIKKLLNTANALQSYQMHNKIQSREQSNDDPSKNNCIKDSVMSSNKSKKSLSAKKKTSNNKSNSANIEIEEIVFIYEAALEHLSLKLQKQQTADFKWVELMVELSTKLYLHHQNKCQYLIKIAFEQIVTNINRIALRYRGEDSKSKSNEGRSDPLLLVLGEMQSWYPTQSAESISRHYSSLENKKHRQRQQSVLWRLLVIFCLMSPNGQQPGYWLHLIVKAFANSQIQRQMEKLVGQSSMDQNFVFAIVVKMLYPSHGISLTVLDLVSELVLGMRLVGEDSHSQFWRGRGMGLLLIRDYAAVVRGMVERTAGIGEAEMEEVERVSILMQRFVVGHGVAISTEYCEYFDKLRRRCRGTLLERNLNSVLECYDAKTSQILKELEDV